MSECVVYFFDDVVTLFRGNYDFVPSVRIPSPELVVLHEEFGAISEKLPEFGVVHVGWSRDVAEEGLYLRESSIG